MSNYDNTNRGVLFDNDRKETDTHPDMTGKLNVQGVEHWFSAWWKESSSGTQFLSVSIGKPVEQRQGQQQPQQRQSAPQQRQGNRPPPRRTAPAGGFDDVPDF
jgi:uncharacterized protein (DUF736 family)